MKNLEQIAAKNLLARRERGGKTPKPPRKVIIIYGIKILLLLLSLWMSTNSDPTIRPWGTFMLGVTLAALLRDWVWFRTISKSWPITEKFLNWSSIEAAAQGKSTPPSYARRRPAKRRTYSVIIKPRIYIIAIFCIIGLIALPFIYPIFSPWSHVNATDREVDLMTGRLRQSTYFYWIRTDLIYKNTAISDEIYDGSLTTPEGIWVKSGTSGLYVNHSPHYSYHSATHQIGQLNLIWEMNKTDQSSRKKQAAELLKLWRNHGEDYPASQWLSEISAASTKVR